MSYHIMLTRKISDIKGQLHIQVQVMDSRVGRIIYFTLDELQRDELPEDLKEYIRSHLSEIEDGRWHYGGAFR